MNNTTAATRPPGIVRLLVRPRLTCTFDAFLAVLPPAVAVDGAVAGPSRWSPTRHVNINHHEGVDRLSSKATCEQALLLLGLGMWPWLVAGDRSVVDVFVNDADADVATTVWELRNRDRVGEPAVQRLVAVEGAVDTAGGIWPDHVGETMRAEVAWVFAPYDDARERLLPTADADTLEAIIDEIGGRITAYADGRGGRTTPASDFEVIARQGDVAAVIEHGPMARTALRRAGVSVFVSVREAGGRKIVTIGALTPFVALDLRCVYERLNQLEGCGPTDRWGGSDTTIGGSPRMAGTALSVATILDVVLRCCRGNDR